MQRYQKIYKEVDEVEHIYLIKEGEFNLLIESVTPNYQLAILGENETLGVDDLIFERKRYASAMCWSIQATVVMILKENFWNQIDDQDKDVMRESF